jgi:probable HAF family extracellular repeat protein
MLKIIGTCLLGGLLLADSATGAEANKRPDGARTTYRIINLAAGDPVGDAKINASGQVAFSTMVDLDSPVRAWFYDGSSIQDIGTLGAPFAGVTGLNELGQVVGASRNLAGQVRAFVWSKAGGMIDLGVLSGANQAWEPAINNAGEVTGYSTGEPLPYAHAFRWTLASGIEDIGAFTTGADSISHGIAINDAGLIAGNSRTAANPHHAFAWTRSGGMVDIDTLGTQYSTAVGAGAKGQVAGNFFIAGGHTRAFVWTPDGGMRDLGTAGRDDAWMVAMSAHGQAVGIVSSDGEYNQAMTWTQEGGMVELGTFGGNGSSAIRANNKGQVVGAATNSSDEARAFVWTARDGMVDLNQRLRHAPAGLTLYSANAISDNGAIVARSNAGLVLLTPARSRADTHAVGPIAAPDMVKVGAPLDASVSFAGEDTTAKHHVTWSWGDGSASRAGNATEQNGAGSASGSHTYKAPGIYTVTATVTSLAGQSATVSRRIVAHDQTSGAAGGTGSFMSPHLPNKAAPFQAGMASFSFVAPSAQGIAATNTGARLHFNVGGMNFRSKDLRAGGTPGQYAGSGTINDAGDYQFSMATTAGEGGQGRFSLKIWHTDPATGAEVVDYDSRGGAKGAAAKPIAAGRITLP